MEAYTGLFILGMTFLGFSLINVKKYFKSDEEKIQEVVDSMRMIEMIWGREAAAKKGIITSFLICSAYIFFYL